MSDQLVDEAPFRLQDLPVEIVISIFELAPFRTLLSLSQCCRSLHDLVENSLQSQYSIALAAANISEVDGEPTSSIRERFGELKRREHAWMRLRFEESGTMYLTESHVYELQHGLFIQGLKTPWPQQGNSGLRIIRLPRSSSAISANLNHSTEPLVHVYSVPFVFTDFNVDPYQDLAVYGCCDSVPVEGPDSRLERNFRVCIRLRRISDGGSPHPHARYEKLELGTRLGSRRGLAFFIQIFGDFIGVLSRDAGDRPDTTIRPSNFSIFNWRTGVEQTRYARLHVDNFIFLSPSYFILVCGKDPSAIMIFSFQPRHTIGPNPPPPQPPRHIISYHLPTPNAQARFTSLIGCRCEPTPHWEAPHYVIEGEPAEGETDTLPYSNNSPALKYVHLGNEPAIRPGQYDTRVAVLDFQLQREARREDFILFIDISKLFEYARGHSWRFGGEPIVEDCLWPWWGQRWSRMMESFLSSVWVCYVYMNRFVFLASYPPFDTENFEEELEQDEWPRPRSSYIGVLDFNPRALHDSHPARTERWTPGSGLDGRVWGDKWPAGGDWACKAHDHTTPTSVGREMFTQEVTTTLPSRRYISYRKIMDARNVMLDGERILLVESDDDEDASRLRILTL